MQFVSCLHEGAPRWGVLDDERVWLAPQGPAWPGDLQAVIEGGLPAALELGRRVAAEDADGPALADITLTAPLPRPRKNVMCLGLNYAAHAAESMRAKGRESKLPEHPVVFTKSTSSVTGPYADVVLDPEVTAELDWEVELAVVVGQRLHKVDATTALAGVFGYTVVNDLSARDLQFRHKQFFLGKSIDGGCPMGPAIVSADVVPDPQALGLRCRVNGVLKQDGHTADQVFGVADTLHRLSWAMTLEPGDIVATGTPDGVGFARQPPEFLAAGDIVACEVDGIGTIRNRIVPRRPGLGATT